METRWAAQPAFRCPYKRQAVLDHAETDRASDRPLDRHRRKNRSEQLSHARPDTQLVECREMGDRNDEAGDDRRGQNPVWHRDIEERDDRHPDDVEDGDHNANTFRAEPIEPAKRELPLLIAIE